MNDKEVIRSSQPGFITSKSCLTNLIAFYNYTTAWMDEGRAVDFVYLNFSKAFDVVFHNILIDRVVVKKSPVGFYYVNCPFMLSQDNSFWVSGKATVTLSVFLFDQHSDPGWKTTAHQETGDQHNT
ncbi:hypothetical protein BTVI_20593 [Pitangus sulphuratus]|nr:hypothetical protein BTVI_20593 [Pitangus sulphuratus]